MATVSPRTRSARRSLRTRLLASFFIAIALPLAVLGLLAVPVLERATLDHLVADLTATARLAASEAAAEPAGVLLNARLARWSQTLGVRIALVDAHGAAVTASSPLPPGIGREPGVEDALRGRVVHGQRSSASGARWLYVAAPVERGGAVQGAVDFLLPLRSVEGLFTRVRWALAAAFGLAVALAAGLVGYLTQLLFRPIAGLSAAAERIGAGDLRQPVPERPDELGDLARVLNTMARRLEEREAVRRDFLANVSHELKTPVANVQFTAQALRAGAAEDPAQRRQMLEIIVHEADRLARIVRQLLGLLRLQSDRSMLAREPVSVADLLEDTIARFGARAEALGIRLGATPAAGLPSVSGDRDQLAEVLGNLVDNALRSTPAGGTVRVAARAEPGSVLLTVEDTGSGIAPDDLPFVFEKFYRGDSARDRGSSGSGLGLSIVKAIVDAHGGGISVDSEVGRGTTFEIRLPLGTADRGAPAAWPAP